VGRGRKGDGVEVRGGSIRLSFTTADGARHKETLKVDGVPVAPTPTNVGLARKIGLEIRREIARGTFDYATYFPDSKSAPRKTEITFGELADQWLKSKGQLAAATKAQYADAVRLWKSLINPDATVESLTHGRIAAIVGSQPWSSPKRMNNALIALRGILAMHFRGPRALESPAIGIANGAVIRKGPDPFTKDERDLILKDMREHYDIRVWAYFAWAFFTGMRPEEIIALRWEDVDERSGVARVRRVRTFKGSERMGSKTHAERDVDLVPQALEALRAMRPLTFMKGVEVFERPVWKPGAKGGKPSEAAPWHDERSQRDVYWKPTLRRLRIRYRRAYCTRHTFATVALMGGVRPAYIAAQMGHTTAVLFKDYAKWIDGQDTSQRTALAKAMGE